MHRQQRRAVCGFARDRLDERDAELSCADASPGGIPGPAADRAHRDEGGRAEFGEPWVAERLDAGEVFFLGIVMIATMTLAMSRKREGAPSEGVVPRNVEK